MDKTYSNQGMIGGYPPTKNSLILKNLHFNTSNIIFYDAEDI